MNEQAAATMVLVLEHSCTTCDYRWTAKTKPARVSLYIVLNSTCDCGAKLSWVFV